MQSNARKLSEGAMMVALFAVIQLLTLYVPLVGIVTMFFSTLPIFIYRLRHDRRSTLMVVTVASVVGTLIGGIFAAPFAITFALIGWVMGEAVALKKSKLYTVMASSTVFLIALVIIYVLSIQLFNVNVVEQLQQLWSAQQDQMLKVLEQSGSLTKEMEQTLQNNFVHLMQIVPAIFMLSVTIMAFIMVLVNFWVARRLRMNVPTFSRFSQMLLPVSTLFIYGVLLLLFIFEAFDPASSAHVTLLNAMIIFQTLFFIQGLAFIKFMTEHYKVAKGWTVVLFVLAIFLASFTVLVGVFDVGLRRAWIEKKE